MKFQWLILTSLSFFFFLINPNSALAGKLLFWRFDSNQNQLIFSTDQGVQPTAQLITNPTRLVIDLPGTILGRPTINENLRGVITSLRIGQFDSNTTRVVVELAPGYTLDPQQIKIKGISPTQWKVDLPNPQKINNRTNPSNPSTSPYDQSRNGGATQIRTTPSPTLVSSTNTSNKSSTGLKVTSNGLLLDINGNNSNKIEVKRSRDRRKIEFELNGITLPVDLPRGWSVNKYGVSQIEISQSSKSPAVTKLTLNVDRNSPDWQASFSRLGGLVLWPQGGMNRVAQLNSNSTNSNPQPTITNTPPPNQNTVQSSRRKTRIEAIEINNNQLLVRGNQNLQAKGNWNSSSGVYELRIDNAELSPQFKSPQLRANSPISRLRIWQPDSNTIIILAQPASGVRLSQLNRPGNQLIALPFTRYSSNANNPSVNSFPSNNNSQNPWDRTPSSISNRPLPPRNVNSRVPKSKVLVLIDPGHGGKDPGAIGIRGVQEKRIVMAISREVAKILEKQGIQVRLSRNNDYFVSLQGRTDLANRIDADLFVSIHANSAGRSKPHVSGLETYYFQSGRNLAATIHRNVLRRVNVNDRKVRQARFYVLRKSAMPAVLVETGFLTGTEDAANLSNPRYQKQMAEGIAAGIIEYVRNNRSW